MVSLSACVLCSVFLFLPLSSLQKKEIFLSSKVMYFFIGKSLVWNIKDLSLFLYNIVLDKKYFIITYECICLILNTHDDKNKY
jgi:hypothetical protein